MTTIAPTSNDIEALARLVYWEAGEIHAYYVNAFETLGFSTPTATSMASTLAYGSIIDLIFNRVSADDDQYGFTIQEVIDKNDEVYWQFEAVRDANNGTGETWEDLEEVDSSINDFVAEWISLRANGQASIDGQATHYFNPDRTNPSWDHLLTNKLQIGGNTAAPLEAYHVFGSLVGTGDALPDYYEVSDGVDSSEFNLPVPGVKPQPPMWMVPPGVPGKKPPVPASFDPADPEIPPPPGSVGDAETPFDASPPPSPLVLDLDGDGVELTTFNGRLSSTSTVMVSPNRRPGSRTMTVSLPATSTRTARSTM